MPNSINKGKRFEREVSKYLEKITNQKFVRVPQSGGTATNWNLSNLCGDVIPLNVLNGSEKQKFVVECKSYNKSIQLQDFFTEKSMLYKFIKQAKEEATQIGHHDEWYLFIKLTRKGVFLIFPINVIWVVKETEKKSMVLTLPCGETIGIKKIK